MENLPRTTSNVANPFVIFTALYIAVASVFSEGILAATLYIALEILAAGIVAGYVFWMRKRSRVGGFWIPTRKERLVPALVLLGAFVGLLVTLLVTNAPAELFRLTLSMGLAAATVAAMTLLWKASAHAAVAGHAAVSGVILLGGVGVVFLLLLPLVVWARVAMKAHTLGQALAGAGVGGAFSLLFLV